MTSLLNPTNLNLSYLQLLEMVTVSLILKLNSVLVLYF